MILALQTMGMPLADRAGNPAPKQINYWIDQGVDYFHIASNDMFHERQRPHYPWEQFRQNLYAYGAAHGVEFMIYGKSPARLVPSGRVLDALNVLEGEGAGLLTTSGYCAEAWEAGKNFLSGQENQHPDCSEVVIDPYGWVHPCCWHELSPGLFDLGTTDFAAGMAALQTIPFCQAIDAGDMLQLAACASIDGDLATHIRDTVGDCGACRLCSAKLAQTESFAWVKSPALSDRERSFYAERLGETTMRILLTA